MTSSILALITNPTALVWIGIVGLMFALAAVVGGLVVTERLCRDVLVTRRRRARVDVLAFAALALMGTFAAGLYLLANGGVR